MKYIFSIVFFFIAATEVLYAEGPFGIQIGQALSELDTKDGGSKPSLNTVPNPHPAFKDYAVWGAKSTGVCVIMAFSKKYDNDRYGLNIRSDFKDFTKALDEKYGQSALIDQRNSGGIWKDPDEWVSSIRHNELIYASTWSSPENLESIAYIELRIYAARSDRSFMRLMYKGSNEKECTKAIKKESNSSF